jgi:hypothetical protein
MNDFAEMHLNYVIWFNQMNDGAVVQLRAVYRLRW